MHSEPYEHDSVVLASFSDFLRSPFLYTPGSYPNGPRDEQPNPVHLWADKVDSYRALTMPSANLTHLDLYSEEALTRRLAPLTSAGGFYPPSQDRIRIEPVLEAATNDKMEGSFSREEFRQAREYEVSREWLRCAPRGRLSMPAVATSRRRVRDERRSRHVCRYYSEEDLAFVNGILGVERMAALGFELINSSMAGARLSRRKPAPSMFELTQHRRLSGLLDHPRWDRIGRGQ